MRALALALGLTLGAAGCAKDVCDGVNGTCVTVHVTGSGSVDGLTLSGTGAVTSGPHTTPAAPKLEALPIDVPVSFLAGVTGAEVIQVVGMRAQQVVGSGAATAKLVAGQHSRVEIPLMMASMPGDGGTASDMGAKPDGAVPHKTLAFAPPANHSVTAQPFSVAVGNFHGEGAGDIAVAGIGSGGGELSILLGNGMAVYPPASTDSVVGIGAGGVAAGDFNGDTKLDLVVTDGHMGFDYFQNNGSGVFAATGSPPQIGQSPGSVATGISMATTSSTSSRSLALVVPPRWS